jgi:IMP dehydrogenase/GMP reductase
LLNPHLAFVTADEIVTAEEPVTVIEAVAVQLSTLVTVTLNVPTARPVIF